MKQFSLLLVCAAALSAQTLQIAPNPLVMTAQANVGGSATLTLTSSGAAIPYIVTVNSGAWLHVSPSSQQNTPSTVNVSTDPMPAGTYTGSINVASSVGTSSVPVTLNVSVAGVNPATLNFQYVSGSNLPPAQSVNVSLPASTTATVTRSTNNGGNWLNIAVTGGNTPTLITATIDPVVAPTLAPNTYTGTITVTPSGTNQTPATVQVTLTVSTTAQVTIAPSSLTFNYQTGGTNNVTQQTIQLTAGAQAVPFSFSWNPAVLNVTPANGTVAANGNVPVTVQLVTPPLASASANLSLTTTSTPQSIPVTVNVSSNPFLNVPATPLAFTYQIGGTVPTTQSVTPTSTGAAITYTVTADQPWLVVPASATTPNPVSIGVNPANQAPRAYLGNVTFTAPGGTPQSVPVTLQVTNNPTLVTNPSSLIFVYQTGQQQPVAQTVSVSSLTGIPLNYVATTSTSWLVLAGHTSGTTSDSFTVSANTTGVPAGVNPGQINIAVSNAATGASLGNVTINVTLDVDNKALLLVTPPQPVVLTGQAGSGQTITQMLTLSSTSSTDQLSLNIPQPSSSWLFVPSPPSATAPGGSGLQLTAVPGSLTAGTYTANVVVTATGPGSAAVLDSPYTIPVTLVLNSGTIAASPTSLTFSQAANAAPPAAQSLNVTSTPAGLNFFVTPYDGGIGWLSASAGTGVAPGSVSVSVDGSRLSPGTYQGRVIVSSTNAAGSPLTIPVTLQVTAGTISAPATPLVFTAPVGSTTPLTQNVAVSGTPGPLNFTVATAMVGGGNWLSATPASGTTPGTVQVTVNPSGLAINTYTGTVTITSAGAAGSPITIPVTLNVVTAQTLTVTPTSLPFAFVLNQAAPPSQTVQVQSSGGAGPFTVATSTNNTGTWLQVTPTSGTTPASLTVSVNPQGLAVGNYTGTITVTSINSLAAAVVQVTFAVTQTPKPVITAVRNAANGFLGGLSPGEIVSVFGTGIGPATPVNGTVTSGKVATVLAGTRVLFDNVEAPIIAASAGQTNVVVPYEVAGRPNTSVRVEFNLVQSDAVVYNVAETAPGIFTLNQQGTGPGAILNAADFSVNSPNAPAPKGGYVSVYITGEGATTPPGATGALIPGDGSGNKKPLATPTVTVGGVPALVQYAGSAPGFVNGFAQVNLQIPANAPSGTAVPIVITFTTANGSTSTQPGVTLVVQ